MENKIINEELLVSYFSGAGSEEERRLLLSWLNESPENEKHFFILKDIYEASASANLLEEAKTEEGWRKLNESISRSKLPKSRKEKNTRFLHLIENCRKYAAIFAIGAMFGLLVMFFAGSSSRELTADTAVKTFEIRTEKGERATIYLPDSSKVVINACSFLSYPADFGERTRELTLTGEGFFDVKTNPDMPFTVKTSGLNIKAFGTVFNVRAYSDEDMVETTLVHGSISIKSQTNQNIIDLKPGQVITIPKEANAAVLRDRINHEVYTSWRDNRWIIESESLESLSKKIERKYDVNIHINGETVKNYVFSGTLKNYPLEQVLETIRLNAPIKYYISEKNVIISEDEYLKTKYEKLIKSPY